MCPKTVLIIGGAGYIGLITAWYLAQKGYKVIILDLKQPTMVPVGTISIGGDCTDQRLLYTILTIYNVDIVIHCAAMIDVAACSLAPSLCYSKNVTTTLSVVQTMLQAGVKALIFSSSAAVYGEVQGYATEDSTPLNPCNSYGWSKYMSERMLHDIAYSAGMRVVIARYFNVAGAVPTQGLGEHHDPETHIIPRLFDAAISNRPFMIYGVSHATQDGTAVRDYVHVHDIARAHERALAWIMAGAQPSVICINIGSGVGTSVQELVAKVQRVTGIALMVRVAAARAGDPAFLVSSIEKANELIGWQPISSTTDIIIATEYSYRTKNILPVDNISIVHQKNHFL